MDWQNAKIECVLERDTDLLLLEEWCVNAGFAEWLLERFGISERYSRFDGYHSVTDPRYGESDLLLIAENDSDKIALLLENKIDAAPQENQAERYFLRAETIRRELGLSNTAVGIIAPDNYLRNDREADRYPTRISYESIAEWFAAEADPRSRYRAAVVKAAIEKERRGYRPIKDEQVSRFWHDYWEYMKRSVPEVHMKEPEIVPAGSDWPELRFSWFPERWKLVHKLGRGVLDLETKMTAAEVGDAEALVKKDFTIVRTGKSFSIRLQVAPLDRNIPLFEQRDALECCVAGIKKFAEKIF